MRIATFLLELWAIFKIYTITKQNASKLSKQTFLQIFHLFIFGVTVFCDAFIVYITYTTAFDTVHPGEYYLYINSIMFMIVEGIPLCGLFLMMICQYKKPTKDSIDACMNTDNIEQANQKSRDLIAEIAFKDERESVPYEYRPSTTSSALESVKDARISNPLDGIKGNIFEDLP